MLLQEEQSHEGSGEGTKGKIQAGGSPLLAAWGLVSCTFLKLWTVCAHLLQECVYSDICPSHCLVPRLLFNIPAGRPGMWQNVPILISRSRANNHWWFYDLFIGVPCFILESYLQWFPRHRYRLFSNYSTKTNNSKLDLVLANGVEKIAPNVGWCLFSILYRILTFRAKIRLCQRHGMLKLGWCYN